VLVCVCVFVCVRVCDSCATVMLQWCYSVNDNRRRAFRCISVLQCSLSRRGSKSPEQEYTGFTLLSHHCCTVVTLLLHCCCTVVTLLLHYYYSVVFHGEVPRALSRNTFTYHEQQCNNCVTIV
jgi:hypothetical protein